MGNSGYSHLITELQGQVTKYEVLLQKPMSREYHEACLLMLNKYKLELDSLKEGIRRGK